MRRVAKHIKEESLKKGKNKFGVFGSYNIVTLRFDSQTYGLNYKSKRFKMNLTLIYAFYLNLSCKVCACIKYFHSFIQQSTIM